MTEPTKPIGDDDTNVTISPIDDELNPNVCYKHQDIEVYGEYGQRGCEACVMTSKLITADRKQLLDRVEKIVGKNPPESEHWRYGNDAAGEIRLRKNQLEAIAQLRKELGL